MVNTFRAKASALAVAICWLVRDDLAWAQGSFIVHTVLTNPVPGGILGDDGVPVYTITGSGPFNVLPIDLNHDSIEDYRVVATGTITWGFQMEGVGINSVWSRPTGGTDIGGFIVPLVFGTSIDSLLPVSDQWLLTEPTPFGINGPGFSLYTFAGELGLFIDQTAYAGLQFQIAGATHYGWVKVQEIPALAGGGIVYEYAYDIRPNTPIFAGIVPEPSMLSLVIASGLVFWLVRRRR